MYARKAPPTSTCAFFNCAQSLPPVPSASASAGLPHRYPRRWHAVGTAARETTLSLALVYKGAIAHLNPSRAIKRQSTGGCRRSRGVFPTERSLSTAARLRPSLAHALLPRGVVLMHMRSNMKNAELVPGFLLHRYNLRSERSFCCLVASFRLLPADAPPSSISLALMPSHFVLNCF
jgi:hypothetical protein